MDPLGPKYTSWGYLSIAAYCFFFWNSYSSILWAALFTILLPDLILFLRSICWVHLSVLLLHSNLGIASCATIISVLVLCSCQSASPSCLLKRSSFCYKLLHFFWALDLLYGSPTSMNFKHYHFIDSIASLVVNWFWHFLPLIMW